jgi:hypothetical protein
MVGDVQTGHEFFAFTGTERHRSASGDALKNKTKGGEKMERTFWNDDQENVSQRQRYPRRS